MVCIWIGIGKCEVVASGQRLSAQHDGGRRAPWSVPVEQRRSLKPANGLCPRSVFECLHISDVSHQRRMDVVSTFAFVDGFMLIGHPHIPWTVDARQPAAQDGLHARVRTCRVVRAIPARLLLRQTVVGPVHGVKTYVSCSQNARALHESDKARA